MRWLEAYAPMIRFIARRIAIGAFVLWVTVTGAFFMLNSIGDPARAHLPQANAAQLAEFRHLHGLDRPLPTRYVEFLGNLVKGDFGMSYARRPVLDRIASRLPRSLLLGALALLFELAIGLSIGIAAASVHGTRLDRTLLGLTFFGMCMPTFLSGTLFLQWFAFRLGWFPVGGLGTGPFDQLRHALLPALTIALIGVASYARIMRSETVEVLRRDYVRTARAKGANPFRVVMVHGARNALLVIVAVVGLGFGQLVSGAIITEAIYDWPGMGKLAVESISNLDAPVVLAIVVLAALAVQIGSIASDIALTLLDPRIRTTTKS